MTDRWKDISELYHAALGRPECERAAFLDGCGEDEEVRREVASLLAHESKGEGLLERPPLQVAARIMANEGHDLTQPSEFTGNARMLPGQVAPGEMLGPYKIEERIGQGGMGEVWRASDTRLRRDVAIKTSHAHFSDRFEREAHAIAALNHPHICALYDVGPNYLVMELLEGDTLRERLKKGKLSIEETLKCGAQIAEALAEAHEKGVIHRDLKPGNVMLTKNGAKVLDFGLAKSTSDESLTTSNIVMGTPAYMSPEQRDGRECSARTDLFALGLLLYEMATGRQMAPGVMLKKEQLPDRLMRVIERCLATEPDERWQSAKEVSAELARAREESIDPKQQFRIQARHAVGIAAVLLLLIAGGVFVWKRAQPKPLTDQDVLVLADFTNTTSDPVFDGALRQALAFELEQSPFLKIMDDQQVNQTLQLMGRPVGQRITNDIAHEVCVREGEKATIGGSITLFTKTYQIALQAVNCQTGATLAREQVEAEDKDHVIKAVAQAARGMRAKLGESLSSIQKTDRFRGNDEVSTQSLEALKAYQLGMDLVGQNSPREAIPHLQRATELDPNFASAHLFLGIVYSDINQAARSKESFTKAFALIDRVSERERFVISGEYYQFVTGELNKALDSAQVLVRAYPRFSAGHHLLATIYSKRGESDKALEQRLEEVRLEPHVLLFRLLLINDYLALGRFDEAKAVSERVVAQKQDNPAVHLALLRIAYMQDDPRAQEKEIQWFVGRPEESQALTARLLNAIVHGQRRQAKEISQHGVELLRRQGIPIPQSTLASNFASIDALVGDCKAARKGWPNLGPCPDAMALRIAQEKAAKNPPQNPETSELLYDRGFAALTTGNATAAAVEFQKIVDHKGRNWGPYYSPAYLGLARAQTMAGDTVKAKRAYEDFLVLWKDADKDLPFYIQATTELAELH